MRDRRVGTGSVRCLLVVAGLLEAPLGQPAVAQYNRPGTEEALNYAFASQLGSGIYEVSGHTVQLYRVPIYFPVPPDPESTHRWRVTIPLCVGFFDLSPEEEGQPDRPDQFATASVVPGVAVRVPLRENWSLEPFAELGLAWNLHESERAYVYSVGLKSLATFHARELLLLLGDRLVYVGERVSGSDFHEDFGLLETGFEVRWPLSLDVKGHALDGGLYVMNYLFLEPTRVFVQSEPVDVGCQFELGLTLGPTEPVEFWRFEFPRLGLGYRFGDGVSAVRFVIGAAF